MGADDVIDIDATSPRARWQRVLALTDGVGADVVVEAAGSPRAFEEGLRWRATAARTSIAGHYTDTGDSTINAHGTSTASIWTFAGAGAARCGHFCGAPAWSGTERVPWARIGARRSGWTN